MLILFHPSAWIYSTTILFFNVIQNHTKHTLIIHSDHINFKKRWSVTFLKTKFSGFSQKIIDERIPLNLKCGLIIETVYNKWIAEYTITVKKCKMVLEPVIDVKNHA